MSGFKRGAKELLEDAAPFLAAAQKAVGELKRSPFFRFDDADPNLMDAELCADVIDENLIALFCMLDAVAKAMEAEAKS